MCVYMCVYKKGGREHTVFFSLKTFIDHFGKDTVIDTGITKGESSTGLALRELKYFPFTILEYSQMNRRKKRMIILSNFISVLRKAEKYIWN